MLTGPEETHAGGASDLHGPFNAAWNRGEPRSAPLPGPSGRVVGFGKLGTPWERMQRANPIVKSKPVA
jgi:hypothetical protein